MKTKVAMKKIMFGIPPDLLKAIESMAITNRLNRSQLIRESLSYYLEELRRRELGEQLKEGYLANANRDLEISEDFKHADYEAAVKYGGEY